MSLAQITNYIADAVEKRGNNGENFGVAIIPEGIVEFVPEFSALIAEINELLAGEKTAKFLEKANATLNTDDITKNQSSKTNDGLNITD